ncbi:MAG: 1-acyl-sn-glycerol-3-phosphate acyltransferase [Clostridia bacterium]|nr:1-acyl-sn-glycerol-3-phosphate acyltransferase [Clostridia bacterium]
MKKYEKLLYKICKCIYKVLLKILYRPKVYGKENIPKEGSLILAGNHIMAVDPTLVMSSTNRIVHYMAKEELFKGFHGWLFKKIGLIKIDREKSNVAAILKAEEILKEGGTIGIFPEGTRNKTSNELLKFKLGTVKMAKETGAKIQPFAIRGQYKLLKKSVELEFGKPIDITNMETNEANDYLKNEILKLLRK